MRIDTGKTRDFPAIVQSLVEAAAAAKFEYASFGKWDDLAAALLDASLSASERNHAWHDVRIVEPLDPHHVLRPATRPASLAPKFLGGSPRKALSDQALGEFEVGRFVDIDGGPAIAGGDQCCLHSDPLTKPR